MMWKKSKIVRFLQKMGSWRNSQTKGDKWSFSIGLFQIDRVVGHFFQKYPGKKTLFLGRTLKWTIIVVLCVLILLSALSPEDDSSFYHTVYVSSNEGDSSQEAQPKGSVIRMDDKGDTTDHEQRLSGDKSKKRTKIKYKAQQVFVRSNLPHKSLPVGTHFVGKLLSRVDTRHSEIFVRVLLPFGGQFKGLMGLPKNTVLLGQASYPGKGARVFIDFNVGILPTGQQVKVSAIATDAKDFSSGLIGTYHSAFGQRVGTTLGLGLISGASEVLQEKQVLGEGKVVKKPTMKNALLNGLSEFVKTEGALQMEEIKDQAYITLNPGKELIVTLTEPFKKTPQNGGESQ